MNIGINHLNLIMCISILSGTILYSQDVEISGYLHVGIDATTAVFPTSGEGLEFVYDQTKNLGFIQSFDRENNSWGDLYLGKGKVGLLTQNPEATLHIGGTNNNSGNSSRILLENGGDVMWKTSSGMLKPILSLHINDNTYLDGEKDIVFRTTNFQERMRIDSAGNVGIGTTSPKNDLEIIGRATDGVVGLTRLDLGGSKSQILHGDHGDWYVRPSLSSGKVVIADEGGKVGIGIDEPEATLHIKDFLKLEPVSQTPSCLSSVNEGVIYYDGTLKKIRACVGFLEGDVSHGWVNLH